MSKQRIDRPLLPASCSVCGLVVLWADGVSRGRARPPAVRCPATGAMAAARAEPLRSFCRSLDGHVRWSLYRWTPTGPLAALRTAGVRHPCRSAGRCPNPCRTTAICTGRAARTRPPWCPAAGRVDRWTDTPMVMVPARRTCGAVGVRPPWSPRRWWGRTPAEPAADAPDGSADAVRAGLSWVPDICRQPAASRHGRRRDVTATGTGRRGGGRWWDAATAGRRGRAGRSGGRAAGRGRRSSPGGLTGGRTHRR